MKTITFDPAVYKLVPVDSSGLMDNAGLASLPDGATHPDAERCYLSMLAAVPDQLPGVVVHSGEPVAWNCNGYPFTDYAQAVAFAQANMFPVTPLYSHPAPSQPDVDELSNFIRTIDGNHQLGAGTLAEKICAWLSTAPSHPSAEALVQAALEAALDAVQNVEINCDASGAAIGSAERRIRALSAQQIIESCKEKS